MPKKLTEQDYRKLCEEIWEHNTHYFVENAPIISDQEFDKLLYRLIEIEKEHPDWIYPGSPTQRVGESAKGSVVVKHAIPMLSLANTYSKEEVEDFLARISRLLHKKEVVYEAELKMDGIALSVIYENGLLKQGITRGNGREGDDVTTNIRTIQALPLQLSGKVPDFLEVRGEVFMPIPTFQKLNAKRAAEGEMPFANPRNAAGGSLKLLDPKLVAERNLSIVFYSVTQDSSHSVTTQWEALSALQSWGLPVVAEATLITHFDAIWKFADKVEKKRKKLPYQIDGVVIKVDDLKSQEKLGYTGKNVRWAVAYKFSAEQAETVIRDIVVQVGRTGVLTPVAELESVPLAGSTISRATLHNEDEVKRKDIRIGDAVVIEKGGDVIPKVVSVVKQKRRAGSKAWKMPQKCPACHTPVMRREGEVAVRCPNSVSCPAQGLRRLYFFVGKGGMDIDHLGVKVVEQLVEKGFVGRISDIYTLTPEQLFQLPNFKEKSVHNLLSSIEASKKVPLARLIMALGIPYVGSETAELLAHRARTLEALAQLSEEEFLEIDGVGDKVAEATLNFFSDQDNLEEIARLLEAGVEPQAPKKRRIQGHPFEGKTFVLTGALHHYTRDGASALIKERGGKVSSSVSKKTDYVLVGDDPGSKYEKAQKLGVTLLTESEFISLLQ